MSIYNNTIEFPKATYTAVIKLVIINDSEFKLFIDDKKDLVVHLK